jgi:hypothetical protein
MVRGPATTQTHWINSTSGASPPSACLVSLSAATGSDRCHAATHNVPIQAQYPLPAPRKRIPPSRPVLPPAFRLPHPRPRSTVGGDDSPELTCTGPHLLGCRVDGGGVTGEVTGYPHLPGTQGRWEQHHAVTFAKVTPPQACKHGRGGG